MSKAPMQDYSFNATPSISNATPLQYRFVVDHNGRPRKLGDGTYGAVFEVRGPDEEKYAVKLFYPAPVSSPTAGRIESELMSGVTVLEKLRKTNEDGLISNLVLSKAWTDKFTDSPAFKKLNPEFTKLGVTVSNHALVMAYYECTLKDVLETGAPSGRLVKGNVTTQNGQSGYEILRGLAVPDRERHIVGIVSQLVTGLRALHAADLFHHDIKPANIMLQSRPFHVDVALGDFGFLTVTSGPSKEGYVATLPFGTRHYRSPEQKDFFDLCDVKVDVGDQQLVLETKDRKFRDTLIEAGDIAEFSKDRGGGGYQVEKVDTSDNHTSRVQLLRKGTQDAQDGKTQVMFYKMPSPRTDVFGVGAILFDLLTIGRSPECFYDYLRPFDRAGDEQPASVNLIVERYRAAASANSTSSDLAPLFDQIRDSIQGRFPSPEIVSVLLRCMLSHAEDSYYGTARDNEGKVDRRKLFAVIQEDLSRLGGRPEDEVPVMSNTNPIWAGEKLDGDTNETTSSFLGDLDTAQEFPPRRRILWGAVRWRQLVAMIGRIRNQDNYFADLGPGNLRFEQKDTEIRPVVVGYKTEDDYLRAVRSGSAWRLETTGDTDNYVPICRRFDARSVEIDMPLATSHVGGQFTAKVRYTESLPVWRKSRPGDLLRSIDGRGRSRLFRILEITMATKAWKEMTIQEITFEDLGVSVGPDEGENPTQAVTVDEGGPNSPDPEHPRTENGHTVAEGTERTRGFLIQRLLPMSYYLSILATYIHHLFFADGERDDGTIPQVVWSALQSGKLGEIRDLPQSKSRSVLTYWKKDDTPDLGEVRSLVARTYLNLISAAEDRTGQNKTDASKMYVRLAKLSDDLDLSIARLFGLSGAAELRTVRASDAEAIAKDTGPDGDGKAFSAYLAEHLDQKRSSYFG